MLNRRDIEAQAPSTGSGYLDPAECELADPFSLCRGNGLDGMSEGGARPGLHLAEHELAPANQDRVQFPVSTPMWGCQSRRRRHGRLGSLEHQHGALPPPPRRPESHPARTCYSPNPISRTRHHSAEPLGVVFRDSLAPTARRPQRPGCGSPDAMPPPTLRHPPNSAARPSRCRSNRHLQPIRPFRKRPTMRC